MKNIYDQFIEYLKKEETKILNLKDKDLERHHLKPLHAGGLKYGPIVICTTKNHTLAHYYRYLTFKQKGDYVSFMMRWNQKIGSTQRALLAVEKNKNNNNLFWDPNWQSIQGKKGGLKDGKANTLKQKKSRQKVGLTYGEKCGINNATNKLKTV